MKRRRRESKGERGSGPRRWSAAGAKVPLPSREREGPARELSAKLRFACRRQRKLRLRERRGKVRGFAPRGRATSARRGLRHLQSVAMLNRPSAIRPLAGAAPRAAAPLSFALTLSRAAGAGRRAGRPPAAVACSVFPTVLVEGNGGAEDIPIALGTLATRLAGGAGRRLPCRPRLAASVARVGAWPGATVLAGIRGRTTGKHDGRCAERGSASHELHDASTSSDCSPAQICACEPRRTGPLLRPTSRSCANPAVSCRKWQSLYRRALPLPPAGEGRGEGMRLRQVLRPAD
jgi:hypothetical protein